MSSTILIHLFDVLLPRDLLTDELLVTVSGDFGVLDNKLILANVALRPVYLVRQLQFLISDERRRAFSASAECIIRRLRQGLVAERADVHGTGVVGWQSPDVIVERALDNLLSALLLKIVR